MSASNWRIGIALGLGWTLACASPTSGSRPPEATELSVEPGFGSEADGRSEAWKRYARGRITGRVGSARTPGLPDPPSFEVEVFAREFMARAWSELAGKRGYRDAYLEDLVRVQARGYLREYTWACLHVLRGLEPSDLEMSAFRKWFAAELPDHRVETWVTAHAEPGRVHFRVGRAAHAPYACGRSDPLSRRDPDS